MVASILRHPSRYMVFISIDKCFSDLSWLLSIKLGDQAFANTVTMQISGLSHLESIEMGNGCFSSASSFAINGMMWQYGSVADLPRLHHIKLGYHSFYKSRSFRMQSLPRLQSIQLGEDSFHDIESFMMNNLTSLVSFDLGGNRFASVTSFAMIGLVLFDFIET